MRKFSIFFSGLFLLAACNNSNTSANIETKPDSAKDAVNYAYTPKEMPNWEMGNPEHTAMVLNSLKKYETGKLDELTADFADSVWLTADQFEFSGTRDSLIKIFKKDWEKTKSMTVEMHDWEAVHGKENKEDWVSLWYKTTWTGKDGKVDSAMYMDDIKIENGKIRGIDSKMRRFMVKK
jgi:hypothetical protein